jgi:hypothetical protein
MTYATAGIHCRARERVQRGFAALRASSRASCLAARSFAPASTVGTDFGVIQITLSAHRLLIGSKNRLGWRAIKGDA